MIRPPLQLFLFAILVAATILISGSRAQASTSFHPGGSICLDNMETAASCDGDTSPGAATDLYSTLCIGWNADCTAKQNPTDSNFGRIVSFTPAQWTLPHSSDVPIGALAGRLVADRTLGLMNNPCNTTYPLALSFLNASVNTTDTISPQAP